jgi:hypothetical protein
VGALGRNNEELELCTEGETMPMSYRIYLERRKALDEECAYTENQYAQAIALRDRAVGKMDAAEANLDNGSEELRAEREHELLESTARADAAKMEVDAATEDRDRALAERKDLEEQFPEFEEAAKERISPSDENAPADIPTLRERVNEYMELGKNAIDTGFMTGGMIAQILTATPDAHAQATPPATIEQMKQEVAREAISLEEHTTQVYEARVSAPAGEVPPEIAEHYSKKERDEEHEKERQKELQEGRDKEEDKKSLESQIEAIGDQEHMTSADDLKEKNNKLLEDMAESSRHPSFPDPEKSAELIAAQSRTVANDNDPGHDGRVPANDNKPGPRAVPDAEKPVAMSAHASTGAGFPDPDPPASALAARAPANDNQPRSPANDNDKDL